MISYFQKRPLILCYAMAIVLFGACLTAPISQAAERARVIPPSEWTWLPVWSDDGSYVAVNWPAPAIIGADGKLDRVIGKLTRRATMIMMPAPSTLSETSKAPVRLIENLNEQRTLILKSPGYELLPVVLPRFMSVCWSPDSSMIAGCEIFLGKVYSIKTGKQLLSFNSDGKFAWSPDSKLIAESHRTGIDVWNLRTKKKVFSFPNLRTGMRCSLTWSPDGTKVAAVLARSVTSAKEKNLLKICSADGIELLSIKNDAGIEEIGWCKDRNLFAYSDQAVHILDGTTLKEISALSPACGGQVHFAWSPNGKMLAYSSMDATLRILDVNTMQQISTIPAEKTGRFRFKWSPDSSCLLVYNLDQLALCKAADGSYVGAKKLDVSVPDWTPDGKNIIISDFSSESVRLEHLSCNSRGTYFDKGTAGNPWQDQKVLRNLDDCFAELQIMLAPEFIENFRKTKEDQLYRYVGGPGLDMALRNTWGLREQNPLTEYFNSLGLKDGRSMSHLILYSFWRHLNGEPLNIETNAKMYREGEKEQELQEAYIVSEKRAAPDSLLHSEVISADGKSVSIAKSAGKIKIVSFVLDSGYWTVLQYQSLALVRDKYPQGQVGMLVFKFAKAALGEDGSNASESPGYKEEIAALERKLKPSIHVVNGTADMYKSLKDFTHGQLGNSTGRLPQTLIIKNHTFVTTRVNGAIHPEDTLLIEDAVDEAIKGDTLH